MIAFVHTPGSAEPLDGNLLCTFESGGEEIKILMTRHAFLVFQRAGRLAVDELVEAEVGFEPTPFTLKQRAAAKKGEG